MTVVRSAMPQLGRPAPWFELPDLDNRQVSLNSARGPCGLLVAFVCNHCPYVAHAREELVEVALQYQDQGVGFVAVNSNDIAGFPDDAPVRMREIAAAYGFPFPYLVDTEQKVALAYQARCTPDFFLHDARLRLVYRGQLDDSRPGNSRPVTGDDLRRALDALIDGRPPLETQIPSYGCDIKWRPENRPGTLDALRRQP